MIKPGTICMIRGVPKESIGYVFNGSIVRVVKYIGDRTQRGVFHPNVHEFEPELEAESKLFNKARETWLHPLDPCEDDLTQETLQRLDDEMRETFINKVVENLNGTR